MNKLALLMLLLATSGLSALDSRLGDSCDLAVTGSTDTAAFHRFDRDLREALAKRDAGAMALLVEFPLRANLAENDVILIDDGGTLQTRFEELFPAALRSTVLNQRVSGIFCNASGIMYGDGIVWAAPVEHQGAMRFKIFSVNPPARRQRSATSRKGRVAFVCDSASRRVIIDMDERGEARLRSWDLGNSLAENPDLLLAHGKSSLEGTSPCVHAVWKFRSGQAVYEISERGCSGEDEERGSRGDIEVTLGRAEPKREVCW